MASRISAVTTVGVFIMAILIGIIVENSIAPRFGVGYGVPAAKFHGKRPPAVAIQRATPSVSPGSHAPAVNHQSASLASVPGAVRLTMLAQRGSAAAEAFGGLAGTQPFVDLQRHSGSWAFGTTAIGVPPGVAAMPETSLFLARASGGRWHVALDGTSPFAQMLTQAPGRLMPAGEEQLLAQYNTARQAAASPGGGSAQTAGATAQTGGQPSAGPSGSTPSRSGRTPSAASRQAASSAPSPSTHGASGSGSAASATPAPTTSPTAQTGLALPWTASESWTMISTPGQQPAGADPLAQASFTGGDGRVLSAGSGRLYRFCTPGSGPGRGDALIEVIHSDGSATEYYQMDNETTLRNGSPVGRGAYLGRTGTSLACGGSTGRPEVEFSLLRAGGRSLDGVAIGGWTFHEKLRPARVWAQRGTKQVLAGAPLRNLVSVIGSL